MLLIFSIKKTASSLVWFETAVFIIYDSKRTANPGGFPAFSGRRRSIQAQALSYTKESQPVC